MYLKDSILNKIKSYNDPFPHWELVHPLSEEMIDELQNVKISDAPRSFDGTRAADAGGDGIDGKLRVFLEKDNSNLLPNGMELIEDLKDKEVIDAVQEKIKKDLTNSYIRIEYIADRKGFWLKPHKDISEKLMTMMVWANPYNEASNLGTDLYDKNFKLVKTIKYVHNSGYFFSSGDDTWHGLELKEIQKERRCIQINYVTFNTDWPVEKSA